MLRLALVWWVLMIGACSSESYIAHNSAQSLDTLSPLSSRQIQREQQLVLSPRYRIEVAFAVDGLSSDDIPDLNLVARDSLARQLRRYFSHVTVASEAHTLQQALSHAAVGTQVLLYPRIESWPNIKPIRIQECEDASGEMKTSVGECEPMEQRDSDEIVVTVGLYDAATGRYLDSIHARSRQGVGSYLFEVHEDALDELTLMVVERLTSHNGYR